MPSYGYTANALADGTVITAANVNTEGNGDAVVWAASGTGGAVEPFTGAANTWKLVALHDANGDGFSYGAGLTATSRLDTGTIAGGAELYALEFEYEKITAATTADNAFIAARNAAASSSFSGYLYDVTTGPFAIRNAAGINVTSAVAGSAVSGVTASAPAGRYKVQWAIMRNTTPATGATSATSTITSNAHGLVVNDRVRFTALGGMTGVDTSTLYYVTAVATNTFQISATTGGAAITVGTGAAISYVGMKVANGRFICRITGITDPTWNGGEYFLDTGYTANVSMDKTDRARLGKTITGAVYTGMNKIRKLRWYSSETPNTSLTKTEAVKNFVPLQGPSVSTTNTGDGYDLKVVGTPQVGGTMSYSITQTDGTTFAPILMGPGVWKVQRDTAGTRTYDITTTESGGLSTVTTLVVPIQAAVTGHYQILQRIAGAWV